jgi:aspartyl protease family protein
MNMDDGASIVYAVGALILLIGSLAARRLPLGSVAKMLLAWVAIFSMLFVIVSYRAEFKQIWNHVKADILGTGNQQQTGSTVRLTRHDDGHFHAAVRVNGKPVQFLIDSGATMTSLSAEAAEMAGIVVDRSTVPVIVETANGAVKDWRAVANAMALESILIKDHSVLISDNLSDDQNLLGMNFLDELNSWRVEGDFMILVP